jgi:glycosyltransferase involved in cell wall biosynthesis
MDGIGRFTYEVIQKTSVAHPEVQFTLIFDRKVDSFSFNSNVKAVVIPPQARHPILWKLWFEFKLKSFINKNKFDLFLSPEGWVPPKLNCPSLAVIHDLNFIHQPENIIKSHINFLIKYFPKYVHRANRIATVSDFSKNDIIKNFNVSSDCIDVVYNGVSEVFKPIEKSEQIIIKEKYSNGSDFFVFVGTLHPRKNLYNLFKAFNQFKKLQKSDIKLLVVGNRKWWPKNLDDLFSSLEFKEDIIFLGRLNDEKLSKLIASSIALTYVPFFEGFGIPILEAFNCHTPVITSNVSSMPEVAADAALICDPNNFEEIANCMIKIAEDPSLAESLTLKGIERCKNFSWDKTAKLLWESILKTISLGS